MKEKIKEYKISNLIVSAVSIIIGVILCVFPDFTLRTIGKLVSIALLIVGTVNVTIYLMRDNEENFMKNDFLRGLVLITLGVCAFIKVEVIIDILPIALGIYIIIIGCKKLQDTIDLIRSKSERWMILMGITAINLAVGILVVCNPFTTIRLLMIIIGVGFVYGGVTDIFFTIYVAKKIGKIHNTQEKKDELKDLNP